MIYLQWVRRFRKYCEQRRLVNSEQLTASGVDRFISAYVGPRLKRRTSSQNTCILANNALHAWACALSALGTPTPPWRERHTAPLRPLLKEYCGYRRVHHGTSERTLVRDIETAQGFLLHLQRTERPIKHASLSDVDAFIRMLATKLSKRTVADSCSSLRAFLRFLRATGRLAPDLASDVIDEGLTLAVDARALPHQIALRCEQARRFQFQVLRPRSQRAVCPGLRFCLLMPAAEIG